MTNQEIESHLQIATTDERRISRRVVELIAQALERKIWALRGYPSAHAWLVSAYGYSDSSAARRLNAARLLAVPLEIFSATSGTAASRPRLLAAVPEVAEKISSGTATLSSLAQLQSTLYREEKRTGQKITASEKQILVGAIEGKSSIEATRTLATKFPEASRPPGVLRPVGNQEWSLALRFSQEQTDQLERAKQLLSHSHPNATWEEILVHLAKLHVQRDAAITKAAGACEHAMSDQRCNSRMRIEVDHIIPRAMGGTNDPHNLQVLCAVHNRLKAERDLGKQWANSWRRPAAMARDTGH